MNNGKTYVNFAAGWLKKDRNGDEYVSASADGKNQKTKLFVELENGETVQVGNFAMFFNKNKQKDNHPDVSFTFTLDSED